MYTFLANAVKRSTDLKGVICKIRQKPYICSQEGYNSWSDGAHAYHVDTIGPTKTQGTRIMF